jgi:hypothetical protein
MVDQDIATNSAVPSSLGLANTLLQAAATGLMVDTQQPMLTEQPAQQGRSFAAMLTAILLGLTESTRRDSDGAAVPGFDQYDLFTRLAELLGPAQPRNAQADDVDKQFPKMTYSDMMRSDAIAALVPPPFLPPSNDGSPARPTNVDQQCRICLTPYDMDEVVRKLNCGHYYHQECIDQWLIGHVNNCPLCRSSAVVATAAEQREE